MHGSWLYRLSLCVMVAIGSSRSFAEVPELPPSVQAAELQRIEAIGRAMPATVSIFVPGGQGGGSGVIIDPSGLVVTNFHVTSPAGPGMRVGLADGRLVDGVLVGFDPVGDVALVQLIGSSPFPAAQMGDSDEARPGQWCIVIGNPFLLSTNLRPSVSFGMISGVHRYQYPSGTLLEYADCLQTDAAINPGNSGGPLFDANGRLIGINGRCSFEKRGRINVGVGYAISINQVRRFLGILSAGRIADHASLGATVSTDSDGRVRVTNIQTNSDAYRRGVRFGDEILSLAHRPVATANDLKNITGSLPAGWRVPLVFRPRNSTTQTTLVRLAGVHTENELAAKTAQLLDGEGGLAPDKERQLSPALAARFEARPGFANYFFNRMRTAELMDATRSSAPSDLRVANGEWELRGQNRMGQTVRVRSMEKSLALEIDANRQELADRQPFDLVEQAAPESLAIGISLWRKLLQANEQELSAIRTWGTAPLLGNGPLRNVLETIDRELLVHWFLAADTGRVECIELWADRARDPAEIHFVYTSSNDSPEGMPITPTAVELRVGTSVVDRWEGLQWQSVAQANATPYPVQ
jgi:S1-C subfamily serine protease